MQPPATLSPIADRRNGFTTLTKLKEFLWRPATLLGERRQTELLWFQTHETTVTAFYRLWDYCCPIVATFDATTGQRVD